MIKDNGYKKNAKAAAQRGYVDRKLVIIPNDAHIIRTTSTSAEKSHVKPRT